MKDRAYFTRRLEQNVESARVERDRVAASHAHLVERGVDTSLPAPAQSPDTSLAKVEARLAFAKKELDRYQQKEAGA